MLIAVWGNAGSGKSTVAIKTALHMSKNSNTLIVDTNFAAPQLQIWFPHKQIENDKSLSGLLANDIQPDILARKIILINDNLGAMGYIKNEMPINTVPKRIDTVQQFIKTAKNVSQSVIVDCQSDITNDLLSFESLKQADVIIYVVTPDLRGGGWYKSNVPMIDNTFAGEKIKVLSPVRRYAPVDAIENVIGHIDYYLPFDEKIYIQLLQGEIGKLSFGNQSYMKIIHSIVERCVIK